MIHILEWKVMTGDQKLRQEIKRQKNSFESWFGHYWANKITREEMLSPNSPVEHVCYKLCKTFDEIKEKYPLEAKEECSSCGEFVDKWIETSFSFCHEYGCRMCLCEKCIDKLQNTINEFTEK